MLRDPETNAEIINVEHVLATLYAYGVDNVDIQVKKVHSKNNGTYSDNIAYYTWKAAKNMGYDIPEVFPNRPQEEYTLSCKLREESKAPVEQEAERKIIRITEAFETEKLSFYPMCPDNLRVDPYSKTDLVMCATTVYDPVGEQKFECAVNPEVYHKHLSEARRYAHHIIFLMKYMPEKVAYSVASFLANFAYPSFGIGHGFHTENVFLPRRTADSWFAQEKFPAEVARHTIVDRLGAIALLGARLQGIRCIMKFSNHENDVNVLKEFEEWLKAPKVTAYK
ncbi:UDP-3-O-acyl-N-acetylglucosamine deacetylase [Candidatus Woesearchaeota archaeon]|nr:UDP-3-O-acyl-N-acetylglucosamine deacetylase [Candidatus Woesearchaeota archaeon]